MNPRHPDAVAAAAEHLRSWAPIGTPLRLCLAIARRRVSDARLYTDEHRNRVERAAQTLRLNDEVTTR